MSPIRVYADTSVFGGVCDEEFEVPSGAFFNQVRSGRFRIVTSPVVQAELEGAPDVVRRFFDRMLPFAEIATVTEDVLRLRESYVAARILTEKHSNDALHVALASVSRCAIIVSWNFKHIVHFQKIPMYNQVNRKRGFGELKIHSPAEVIAYENEDP